MILLSISHFLPSKVCAGACPRGPREPPGLQSWRRQLCTNFACKHIKNNEIRNICNPGGSPGPPQQALAPTFDGRKHEINNKIINNMNKCYLQHKKLYEL